MSEVEDKILGKLKKTDKEALCKDYLAADNIWKIRRYGCVVMLTNGLIAAEQMDAEAKAKALKGVKKITCKDFVFERAK